MGEGVFGRRWIWVWIWVAEGLFFGFSWVGLPVEAIRLLE